MTVASHVLYRPDKRYFWIYCLGAALVAALGSLALASAAHYVGIAATGVEPPGPTYSMGWLDFFGVAIFAPLLETALLVVVLGALSRSRFRPLAVAALAALLGAGLHGLLYPLWFFGTVWSLFVFSCAYLAWRTHSAKFGFWAAALPHALLNSAAFLLMTPGTAT